MSLPLIPVPGRDLHGKWDLARARTAQRRLRDRVETRDRPGRVETVAGADVSYDRRDTTLYSAVVVLDADTLETRETATAVSEASFPYLPGFLSFREAPAVEQAIAKLSAPPDLLMVDGHGQAHPRGFGLACHLGLSLDLRTLGVAKSRLVGTARLPAPRRGACTALRHDGTRIGSVVRTRDGVAPVWVSVGHGISLGSAVRWVLRCAAGYRIPEPTRRAHLAVNALRARGGAS